MEQKLQMRIFNALIERCEHSRGLSDSHCTPPPPPHPDPGHPGTAHSDRAPGERSDFCLPPPPPSLSFDEKHGEPATGSQGRRTLFPQPWGLVQLFSI